MSRTTTVRTGFPIFGILGVVFITLKLLDKIDWSWWWVTAPFWGPLAVFLVILGVLGLAYGVLALWLRREQRKLAETIRRYRGRR